MEDYLYVNEKLTQDFSSRVTMQDKKNSNNIFQF